MATNSFKNNTLMLIFGTVLNKGLQFLVIPFFSRWLTKEAYGQFDLYYSYVMLFLPILSLATQEAVFRFGVDENDVQKKKQCITTGLIINVVSFFLFTVIVCSLDFFQTPKVLFGYLLYLSAELINQHLRGFLRAIKRLDIYSYAMVISTVCMTILVTFFVKYMSMGLFGMMFGYALGSWLGNLAIIFWSGWIKMIAFNTLSYQKAKEIVRYSIHLVPNDVSWWIMNASDRQIINLFFGDTANGVYAIAHKIPALCSVVSNMFSLSWQQEVISNIESPNRNEYFNKVFNSFVVVLFTACSGLLASGFIFYNYIFDIKYYDAIKYSPILICAALIMSISQFLGGIQIALKQSKKNGITTVVGAICNIIVHLLLVNIVGLYAAAVSTLVGNLLTMILRLFLLKDIFRVEFGRKTIITGGLYIYFFAFPYLCTNIYINVVNLFLAGIIFIFFNKKLLLGLIRKA